jgi:hypothetical protein
MPEIRSLARTLAQGLLQAARVPSREAAIA